jgi:hypothetical protein
LRKPELKTILPDSTAIHYYLHSHLLHFPEQLPAHWAEEQALAVALAAEHHP